MNKPVTSPDLPNLVESSLPQPNHHKLAAADLGPPRILLLYGSLRPQSF
ncbi:arsenical resistance protein ArsH, partial [Klebsiella pneumoniae]|nr:arsenical resistance protein ArsH [Klebsiella pneumoniae]